MTVGVEEATLRRWIAFLFKCLDSPDTRIRREAAVFHDELHAWMEAPREPPPEPEAPTEETPE